MRILHTADWQLGLKLRFLAPERAAQLRLLRFQTVRAIAELAKHRQVDVVLVAGDVLDDNALGLDALQQTEDALRAFGDIPVLLLPGNHDAATADSALGRLRLPGSVRLMAERAYVDIAGARIYACPLQRRHESSDPTAWLPEREAGEGIRIAMAHGGVIDFAQSADSETPNLIDANKVIAKGFDYLALGDWHGTFRYSARAWYPGAHEATRFKEQDPGAVLVVDIDQAGAEPKVERVPVAQTQWLTISRELVDGQQVERLKSELDALPERSQTLVELVLTGALSLADRDILDVCIEDNAQRLAYLRADLSGLQVQPTEADLQSLATEGFLSNTVATLRESTDDASTDALRLLFRLQQGVTRATA